MMMTGMILNSEIKLVHGVGINDANYKTNITWWDGEKQHLVWRCPYYVKWKGILRRCYAVDKYKTYQTSVTDSWKSFANFRCWLEGLGIPEDELSDYDLDKDLIGDGTLYSPETCVLVPHVINTFILDKENTQSLYPTGVYFNKERFVARCNNPLTGKREHIGSYNSPEVAHIAWKSRKYEILKGLKDK